MLKTLTFLTACFAVSGAFADKSFEDKRKVFGETKEAKKFDADKYEEEFNKKYMSGKKKTPVPTKKEQLKKEEQKRTQKKAEAR
jgi:hypothetical protein